MLLCVLGVDLGDDQRHIGVHTEGGGVIHKDGAGRDNGGRKLLGNGISRSAEDDVHAGECLVACQLHGELLALEGQLLADGALARQDMKLLDGEFPLCQDFHHFSAHSAGGAEDRNLVLFHCVTS